ncbi:MAG: hypothetical protein ABSF55_00955 [Candidatus Staskawiczbacteria bacterium]|jgi:hypothetical protein
MLYSYVELSKYDFGFFRILGSGLGNLLFPWARSVVANQKYDLKPIAPTWPQIKLGPILRGESDPRFYSDLFLTPPESIHGIEKLFLLATKKKIEEPYLLTPKSEIAVNYKDGIFVFCGMKNFFKDILRDHNLIRQELLKITKNIHKTGLNYNFTNCVSMHIRRSDFKLLKWDTSIEWFLWVMNELRSKLKFDINFKIFSDGSDEDLALILKQKNVERVSFGSALADLLALSKSRILVGSYKSTFSMWASYLGRMPTIWPKNSSPHLYYEIPENEVEFSSEAALRESFISICRKFW